MISEAISLSMFCMQREKAQTAVKNAAAIKNCTIKIIFVFFENLTKNKASKKITVKTGNPMNGVIF